MVKETKKEHSDYIVSLPSMVFADLENILNFEIISSTSDRGAVSHALARKVLEGLPRKLKSEAIRHAMNQLDDYHGGAGNYAYEVHSEFLEDGIKMAKSNPKYRDAQEAFLAEEIGRKRGEKDMLKLSRIARVYSNFYNSCKP